MMNNAFFVDLPPPASGIGLFFLISTYGKVVMTDDCLWLLKQVEFSCVLEILSVREAFFLPGTRLQVLPSASDFFKGAEMH